MSLFIKDSGNFSSALQKGNVSVKESGSWVTVNQLYVKDSGVWVPMWTVIPNMRYGYTSFNNLNAMDDSAFSSFASTYLTTSTPNNDSPQDVTFNDGGGYVYMMWPASLGELNFIEFSTVANYWGQGETYEGELSDPEAIPSDPGALSFNFDDGTGSIVWKIRRSNNSGTHNGAYATTLYLI